MVAEAVRRLVAVLTEHDMVRKLTDGTVLFDGKARRDGWEVRL